MSHTLTWKSIHQTAQYDGLKKTVCRQWRGSRWSCNCWNLITSFPP